MQYGCDETRKERVLAFCRHSDNLLQFLLGRTAYATARRWGAIAALLILCAAAVTAAGVPL